MTAQAVVDSRALELAAEAKQEARSAKETSKQEVKAHEDVCAIRYEGINTTMDAIKNEQSATQSMVKGIYDRLWKAALAVIAVLLACTAGLITAISVVVFHMIKNSGQI